VETKKEVTKVGSKGREVKDYRIRKILTFPPKWSQKTKEKSDTPQKVMLMVGELGRKAPRKRRFRDRRGKWKN